jgi:NAD(P)-dependent dehydrogenase (short-subunit alcohol dehydrogenase family)
MKSVLVTGASTGIGAACAARLDRLGVRVFAGVRNDSDAERLRSAGSDRVVPLLLDVTNAGQISEAAQTIDSVSGCLSGVVNNAGTAHGGPIEFLGLDEWRSQFDVNVFGAVAVTKAMMPLIRAGNGRVVFIGSIGGKVATGLMGPYNASKFAIEAIGESLRHELHPWGIRVSVVEPGAIKTAIWDKGRSTADRLERELPQEAAQLYRPQIDAIRKAIDMQDNNGVSPDKVAAAVEHALMARRPRTRYLVGTDARIQSALVRLLPDRPREALIRKVAGP